MAVLLLLASCCFGAGWSEVWPSEEHPRETYRQLSECYTSVTERIYTSWASGNAPTWWRSNYASFVRLKGGLATALIQAQWVKTNDVTTPADAVAWLNADASRHDWNWYGVGGNTYAPLTSICAEVQIPTNYFDYTPWRFLTGLGSFTNDTSTPYPHGYTNATTAAGGTEFPAGRTRWYTTDYGWNQFPKLIAKLLYVGGSSTVVATNLCEGYGFNYTNWTGAKTTAEADYAYNEWSSYTDYGTWGMAEYGSPDRYFRAYISMSRFNSWFSAVDSAWATTGFTEYYYCADTISGYGSTVFDDNGFGLTEDQYAYVANDQTNYWGECISAVWGNTNKPSTWCATPGYGASTSRGFREHPTRHPLRLRRFNIPGGFRFY